LAELAFRLAVLIAAFFLKVLRTFSSRLRVDLAFDFDFPFNLSLAFRFGFSRWALSGAAFFAGVFCFAFTLAFDLDAAAGAVSFPRS
jgi:hypothetical protein